MSQKLQYALDTNLFVSLAISIGGPERIAMLELIHDKGELVVFQYVLDGYPVSAMIDSVGSVHVQ